MKILVTGSEGFFGSHLVEKILESGHDVKCFVQYNSFSSIGWLEDVFKKHSDLERNICFGDIRDVESVSKAVLGADVCINLAALIAIPYSYLNPRSYFETNVIGTFNIMESCLKAGVKRVIHVSTSEVYGTPKLTPISESHPIQTQSPYAASKAGADHLAMSYHYSFDLPLVILRPFNLFGPRQSTRAVIPSIITQALSGEIVQVGSTSPKREFNFAPEVSNIFLNVALSDRGVGEIFNVGNGFDLSIREVINLILNNIGKECTVKESLERIRPKLSEVQKLQSDSSKLLDTFGLKYSLSGLEGFKDALAETIAWYSLPSNLQKFNSQNYGV